jgi:hypothetical protein
MENHSPEKTYEDRMNNNITMEEFRSQNLNKILTLRKEKHNKDTISSIRGRMNFLYEPHYSIHLNLLKTNNDDIRNFFIDLKDADNTMIKLKYLLNSKDDDEVKYGLYATRKHLQLLMRGLYHTEDNKDTFVSKDDIDKKGNNELEIFMDNNIIDLLFNIIKNNINKYEKKYFTNIYEVIWIFINMSTNPPKKEEKKIEFYKIFVKNENLNYFLTLIQDANTPKEIINNIMHFLSNISHNVPIIINKLIQSDLTKVLLFYLKANQNINLEILDKIFRILNNLYKKNYTALSLDAYKTLFKICSLPLYNFKKKEIIKNCLEILLMLSNLNYIEIEQCFNDLKLIGTLNNIIFNDSIEENEQIIAIILDIYFNLILKASEDFKKNIIFSGIFQSFYNNLVIKYKNEKKIMDYQTEENFLMSINNIILYNRIDVAKYILSEGKEIMNYFIECSNSVFKKTRLLGTQSLLNILLDRDQHYEININILYDIVNSIINTLNINEFSNCYYICTKIIYLIIERSESMNFYNELKQYLNNKGFINFLDKIETKSLNDSSTSDESVQDEGKIIVNEIKEFLIK